MTTGAGWHPDPRGIFSHRWWDGTTWTEHVAVDGRQGRSSVHDDTDRARVLAATLAPAPATREPAVPHAIERPAVHDVEPHPVASPAVATLREHAAATPAYAMVLTASSPPASTRPTAHALPSDTVEDRWMLGIIAVPVITGVLQIVAVLEPATLGVLALTAMGCNIGFARADMTANPRIRARTDRTMLFWAWFLMPVYLFRRQRALDRGLAPFGIHLVLAIGVAAIQVLSGTFATLDMDHVEDQIQLGLPTEPGVVVDVECHGDQPARAGHRFLCQASDGEVSVGIQVEVLNGDGDFIWEVVGFTPGSTPAVPPTTPDI